MYVCMYVCTYINSDLLSETLWFILKWYRSSAVVQITG